VKTFKDCNGREWEVAINITTLRRVRDTLDIDLLKITGGEMLPQVVSDPYLLVNIIYVLCSDQAEEAGICDEDFGRAMAGDAIDEATKALLDELVNFSPSLRRPLLTKAMTKMNEVEKRAVELASTKLDSPEMEAEIEKALTSGSSSTSSPDKSE